MNGSPSLPGQDSRRSLPFRRRTSTTSSPPAVAASASAPAASPSQSQPQPRRASSPSSANSWPRSSLGDIRTSSSVYETASASVTTAVNLDVPSAPPRKRARVELMDERARVDPTCFPRTKASLSIPSHRTLASSRTQLCKHESTRCRVIETPLSLQPSRAFSLFRSSPSANAAAPSLQPLDSSIQSPPPSFRPASDSIRESSSSPRPHRPSDGFRLPTEANNTLPSQPGSAQGSTSSPSSNHSTQPKTEHEPNSQKAEPRVDQINSLLRHPTLYDPIRKPRNPIVLCHGQSLRFSFQVDFQGLIVFCLHHVGLYGFDVRGPSYLRLHYWGDLLSILRGKVGAEVFVTAVPGTGSIKQRAHSLHRLLEENQELHGQQLNFLAHSMGGLDARYLFSQIRPETYHPISLTTLSTPHRGSEFMAWCRANIGIGTDYDVTSAEAARLAHEDTSVPLPFSLKSPILHRVTPPQEEEAIKAAEQQEKIDAAAKTIKTGLNLAGLPKTLTASLSNYLLDLLDSPAYANLTPNFLREVFNPLTPNRDDIKYYSVASRTDKIPIWHPLWLPKQVLDGAESARLAKGIHTRPNWVGNDGLVTIESAQWGEFLGVIENCDHWEMRGSSGLISAAASASAVTELAKMATRPGREDKSEATEATSAKKGWQWQDLYRLIGSSRNKSSPPGPAAVAAATVGNSHSSTASSPSDEPSGLTSMASWIVKALPGIPSPIPSSISSFAGAASPTGSNSRSTSSPRTVVDDPRPGTVANSVRATDAGPQRTTTSGPAAMTATARIQYGAPTSTGGGAGSASKSSGSAERGPNGAAEATKPANKLEKEKFSLEKMTVAICRKLYDDGL
ncbi:BZ3500_MvSof-1268-A1-R1_Chr2-1g04501 [Microbotryum saponariae]|uniref:BZ3500_MvSof-1268-A1-R1_Chr2-1g04501 protein n=1 Tax=Microbotryum saponariae TaxID=289078 RepID=A0A2X0KD26_9BASI|nr:BZ3500_MvSof-1268-A1-R1_Chr2-1g04501 [Microbotryum saponariae]SCZ91858.1 BZ3501_MvSof-1269-A2-R1_Chr2-1g04157 [Microbotryum saponariae]